jgi:hypothetical protein
MVKPRALLPERKDDWVWAKTQYECTEFTTEEIATAIGVSMRMLISRANTEGWSREKRTQIIAQQAQYEANQKDEDLRRQVAERTVIERVNVEMQAKMLVEHRTDIAKIKQVGKDLLQELSNEALVDSKFSLDAKSKIFLRLVDAMKTTIVLERQAYGVVSALQDPEAPVEGDNPEGDAMTKLLNKFASVLNKTGKPEPNPIKDMGNVVEVDDDSR